MDRSERTRALRLRFSLSSCVREKGQEAQHRRGQLAGS
jgi:hypothetical protein